MDVRRIEKKDCDRFIGASGFSGRRPIFWAGYGLFNNERMEGSVEFGEPSPPLQKHAFYHCIDRLPFAFYELSALVVSTDWADAEAFLLEDSVRQLTLKPFALVTFVEMKSPQNEKLFKNKWFYTGTTVNHDVRYLVDGEWVSALTVRDRYHVTAPKRWAKRNCIPLLETPEKRRYFQFFGTEEERRVMKGRLRYAVTPQSWITGPT